MESLPTEVKDKIIDFKNGDNKYWKNEYNKVMNEINNIKTCVYCKRRFNKVDLLDYIYICNEEFWPSLTQGPSLSTTCYCSEVLSTTRYFSVLLGTNWY